MQLNLVDKTALVCGSSKGIGAAIAHSLAAEGARIILVARHEDELSAQVKSLTGSGHRVFAADLHSRSSLNRLIEFLSLQEIDIVINNTGGPAPGSLVDAQIEDFQKALDTHLFASHRIMQAVIPGMKKRNFGRFINVISTSVKIPIPGLGVSNTTRGAMASWAKTLSLEVAPFGITVNNILPGSIRTARLDAIIRNTAGKKAITEEDAATEMRQAIPAGRFGEPDELGHLAAFLASEKAAYITGVSIPVDGGRTGSL